MSWLRPFLVGLFTEHLKTKFMALTLAVVLFATVQETLVGMREIEKVTLVFRLSATLQNDWVLLEPRVTFRRMRIKGLRSVVDAVATERERASEVEITVDEDFLARHRPPVVRLDPEFLRSENVPGARLNSIELPEEPPLLRFTAYRTAQLEVAVAPDSEPRLLLSATGPYEATGEGKQKLAARFSIPNVVLRAPATAFAATAQERPLLYVSLGDIEGQIPPAAAGEERTSVRLPVLAVEWEQSGLSRAYLEHMRIEQPEPMSAEAFEKRIEILFEVQARYETREFRVPIAYRTPSHGGDPLQGYSFFDIEGFRSLSEDELRAGRCDRLALRYAQSLAREKLEEKLLLVLDLTQLGAMGDPVRVPVHLDVRDAAFRPLLRGVSFQRTADGKSPVAIFEKKKE